MSHCPKHQDTPMTRSIENDSVPTRGTGLPGKPQPTPKPLARTGEEL